MNRCGKCGRLLKKIPGIKRCLCPQRGTKRSYWNSQAWLDNFAFQQKLRQKDK